LKELFELNGASPLFGTALFCSAEARFIVSDQLCLLAVLLRRLIVIYATDPYHACVLMRDFWLNLSVLFIAVRRRAE